MTKLVAAAITNGQIVLTLPRPARHADIVDAAPIDVDHKDWIRGFLNDEGEFLTRGEALDVAMRARQVKTNRHGEPLLYMRELHSADLW